MELSHEQVAEFLHRSYHAVDGLWFMKVEERYGLEAALDLDNEVWKVVPKIQARALKSMAEVRDGLDALSQCLATKLSLDGFEFAVNWDARCDGFTVEVSRCPWHEAMLKSGREHLSGPINSLICHTELSVWAAEFGAGIGFVQSDCICAGAERCLLRFATG